MWESFEFELVVGISVKYVVLMTVHAPINFGGNAALKRVEVLRRLRH